MRDVHFQTAGENPVAGVLTLDVTTRLIIEVGGKRWRLIWSEMWGPSAADRHGDIANTQPGPKHQFWRAATLWNRQGRRRDGLTAVWHEPAPEIIRVKGRMIVEVVQHAEDPDHSRQIILRGEPTLGGPTDVSDRGPGNTSQLPAQCVLK